MELQNTSEFSSKVDVLLFYLDNGKDVLFKKE